MESFHYIDFRWIQKASFLGVSNSVIPNNSSIFKIDLWYALFNFSTKPCIFPTFRAKTPAHLQAVR